MIITCFWHGQEVFPDSNSFIRYIKRLASISLEFHSPTVMWVLVESFWGFFFFFFLVFWKEKKGRQLTLLSAESQNPVYDKNVPWSTSTSAKVVSLTFMLAFEWQAWFLSFPTKSPPGSCQSPQCCPSCSQVCSWPPALFLC